MKSRRHLVCSDKAHTYLKTIQIFYYPDKTLEEILDGIIESFEQTFELKSKLVEE